MTFSLSAISSAGSLAIVQSRTISRLEAEGEGRHDRGPHYVCCPFYNGNGGVCDTEERCPTIYRLTMELGGQTSTMDSLSNNYRLQHPRSASMNTAFVILGLILIILVVIAFAYLHPENRKKLRKGRKRKKK